MSGCIGGTDKGSDKYQSPDVTKTAQSSQSTSEAVQSDFQSTGRSTDWCKAGAESSVKDASGSVVSKITGISLRGGKEYCELQTTTSSGIVYQYTDKNNEEYYQVVKDANGKTVYENSVKNPNNNQ